MKLEDVRKEIDALDPQIKTLILRRMDCSLEVAKAKQAAGETTIYRRDREKAILDRLGADVPADRLPEYLAVVRKIMETSRMFQYGLLFDWNQRIHLQVLNPVPDLFKELSAGIDTTPGGWRVKIRLTRPDEPNAMSSILSMVGDYGFNMQYMELMSFNEGTHSVTFDLTILGDLSDTAMQKLLFQLSKESEGFVILQNDRKDGAAK